MKRVIVLVLALAVIFVAGLGIVSQLRDRRQDTVSAFNRETAFKGSTGQPNQSRRGKRELQDPEAREALRLVGVDAKAEAYWLKAINNPKLPGNEREDLIEDLNE